MRNAELGRGSRSARRCAFCRGACPRFTPGDAVLLSRFVLRSRLLFVLRQTGRLAVSCVSIPPGRDRHSRVLAVLFGYLPLWVHFGFAFLCGNPDGVTTGIGYAKKSAVMGRSFCNDAVLLRRFALGSRLLFAAERQTGRLAMPCVSIPPGRDRHSCVLAALFGYLPWLVHFGFVRFFMAISTGYRSAENGDTGLAARR